METALASRQTDEELRRLFHYNERMPSKYALPKYTLRQLAYFVATAEAGTTSGAADRLYVSQSALSSGLDDLEAALDVQLMLRRKGRGIDLTETGRRVMVRAREL